MDTLFILWTNADEITFDKMVAMYARNSMIERWWGDVTLIIWGGTAKLASQSELVRQRIKELIQVGVKVTACKACSDALGTTQSLREQGIEVKYWGQGLTEVLKSKANLLTI